jgi:hypothetical protein
MLPLPCPQPRRAKAPVQSSPASLSRFPRPMGARDSLGSPAVCGRGRCGDRHDPIWPLRVSGVLCRPAAGREHPPPQPDWWSLCRGAAWQRQRLAPAAVSLQTLALRTARYPALVLAKVQEPTRRLPPEQGHNSGPHLESKREHLGTRTRANRVESSIPPSCTAPYHGTARHPPHLQQRVVNKLSALRAATGAGGRGH